VARETRPGTALTDLGLPGLDGCEVAGRLRALLGDRVRLIALSGYSRADGYARRLAPDFDAYLVKPVLLADLARVLERPGGAPPLTGPRSRGR